MILSGNYPRIRGDGQIWSVDFTQPGALPFTVLAWIGLIVAAEMGK
jgi:hypothetical protein